jgi:hypothetical protein
MRICERVAETLQSKGKFSRRAEPKTLMQRSELERVNTRRRSRTF